MTWKRLLGWQGLMAWQGLFAWKGLLGFKNVASLDGSDDEEVKLAVARSLQELAQYKAVGHGEVALAIAQPL